jgi:hypothetical protein
MLALIIERRIKGGIYTAGRTVQLHKTLCMFYTAISAIALYITHTLATLSVISMYSPPQEQLACGSPLVTCVIALSQYGQIISYAINCGLGQSLYGGSSPLIISSQVQ